MHLSVKPGVRYATAAPMQDAATYSTAHVANLFLIIRNWQIETQKR
jgi:hypothetical protein